MKAKTVLSWRWLVITIGLIVILAERGLLSWSIVVIGFLVACAVCLMYYAQECPHSAISSTLQAVF